MPEKMRVFDMFPEGSDFHHLSFPTHHRSSALIEDTNVNFVFVVDNDSRVAFTPTMMADICSTFLFNEYAKLFK